MALLRAAFLGTVGAIAADVGVAAACGAPLTAQDVAGDIVGGGTGGLVSGLLGALGVNDVVVAIVGAFVAGFISQALFPPSPIPPHEVDPDA